MTGCGALIDGPICALPQRAVRNPGTLRLALVTPVIDHITGEQILAGLKIVQVNRHSMVKSILKALTPR